ADILKVMATIPTTSPIGPFSADSMQTDPNLLRVLFDAAPEGVMVCDAHAPDMPVVYVNRAMEHLTGYPVTEILGRNPRFLYGSDTDQDALKRLRAALNE